MIVWGLAYSWMVEISWRGSMFVRGSGSRHYCSIFFFAAVIILVLQRFAEDLLIVSDLVYLDDAPKGEDGRSREEGTSGNGPASGVGDAVCRRCGGGVDIASWAYQDDGRYSCRMSGIRTDSVGKKIPRP